MRVLLHSNAYLASHHRLVELLADEPGLEIIYSVRPDSGLTAGPKASANGRRTFVVQPWRQKQWGRSGDPHRYGQWPPNFGLRHLQPDLIHCMHEQESVMTLQLALARLALTPRSQMIISAWQNILRPRRWPVWLLNRIILHTTQHAFCASRGAAEVLRAQGFRGGITITPLGGVDTRWMHPKAVPRLRAQLGLNPERPVVGNIGRLSPEKGLDVLLRAVAQLAEFSPQVLLMGEGPARAELERLARELNIFESCRFVGPAPPELVVDYMNVLDIFVLPSRTTPTWKEQFGRVLAEAMACRVPVVGSDSGAIPEVLGEAGRLFREGDADDLAKQLRALLTTEGERVALAERGYRRALQKYTVEALAACVLQAWYSLSPGEAQR